MRVLTWSSHPKIISCKKRVCVLDFGIISFVSAAHINNENTISWEIDTDCLSVEFRRIRAAGLNILYLCHTKRFPTYWSLLTFEIAEHIIRFDIEEKNCRLKSLICMNECIAIYSIEYNNICFCFINKLYQRFCVHRLVDKLAMKFSTLATRSRSFNLVACIWTVHRLWISFCS